MNNKKKNKSKYFIIFPFIGIIIVHLLFSYINWDINPANWSLDVRTNTAMLIAFSIFIGLVAAIGINDIFNQNQNK